MSESKAPSGIYLLPNLFTTSALFAGFYAIVAAERGDLQAACVAIFIAMIFDSLDGRVARMTNTQSEFGAQYDSLADMVSSGVAPALVAYLAGVLMLGKVGWLAAFFYTASTALRLARFNVQAAGAADKRYFKGLPCPAAAATVTATIWAASDYGVSGFIFFSAVGVMLVILGGLMVSNIKYYSFKDIDLKGKVPFVALLVVVLLFMLVSLDPPVTLLLFFSLYVLSGPVVTLRALRRA